MIGDEKVKNTPRTSIMKSPHRSHPFSMQIFVSEYVWHVALGNIRKKKYRFCLCKFCPRSNISTRILNTLMSVWFGQMISFRALEDKVRGGEEAGYIAFREKYGTIAESIFALNSFLLVLPLCNILYPQYLFVIRRALIRPGSCMTSKELNGVSPFRRFESLILTQNTLVVHSLDQVWGIRLKRHISDVG